MTKWKLPSQDTAYKRNKSREFEIFAHITTIPHDLQSNGPHEICTNSQIVHAKAKADQGDLYPILLGYRDIQVDSLRHRRYLRSILPAHTTSVRLCSQHMCELRVVLAFGEKLFLILFVLLVMHLQHFAEDNRSNRSEQGWSCA